MDCVQKAGICGWDGLGRCGMRCDKLGWDGMRCDAMRCDAMRYDAMGRGNGRRDPFQTHPPHEGGDVEGSRDIRSQRGRQQLQWAERKRKGRVSAGGRAAVPIEVGSLQLPTTKQEASAAQLCSLPWQPGWTVRAVQPGCAAWPCSLTWQPGLQLGLLCRDRVQASCARAGAEGL